jgi:hypothetical protein
MLILLPCKNNKNYIFRVWVFTLRCPPSNVHASYYIVFFGLSGSTIFFPHYLINGTIFGEKILDISFDFLYYFCLKPFSFRRRIERYIINVHRSSCKVPAILERFEWKLNFLNKFPKYVQIWNYWKSIQCRPSCSMQKNGQTDRL